MIQGNEAYVALGYLFSSFFVSLFACGLYHGEDIQYCQHGDYNR